MLKNFFKQSYSKKRPNSIANGNEYANHELFDKAFLILISFDDSSSSYLEFLHTT